MITYPENLDCTCKYRFHAPEGERLLLLSAPVTINLFGSRFMFTGEFISSFNTGFCNTGETLIFRNLRRSWGVLTGNFLVDVWLSLSNFWFKLIGDRCPLAGVFVSLTIFEVLIHSSLLFTLLVVNWSSTLRSVNGELIVLFFGEGVKKLLRPWITVFSIWFAFVTRLSENGLLRAFSLNDGNGLGMLVGLKQGPLFSPI